MVWRASIAERDIAFAVLTALFDVPAVLAVLADLPDRRTGSTRPVRGEVAEPFRLELRDDLLAAAAAWTELGCPYEAALALMGTADEAALRQALRYLTDLRATPAIRIVRRKLRSLGARSIPTGPHAVTRANPGGLTRRERQVIDLMLESLTNPEIAARLFISHKTVDRHVSSILAKLGVQSRVAVGREAARLGLVRGASG